MAELGVADDRAARARGDITRGRLVPLVGALAGGGLAAQLGAARAVQGLLPLVRTSFSGRGDPGTLAADALGVVARLVLPVLLAALAGALLAGMVQTRGYIGAPGVALAERATPTRALGLGAWGALMVLLLVGLHVLTSLGVGAEPVRLAGAAIALSAGLAWRLVAAIAVVALVDHLLRARARRQRLAGDATPPRRVRTATATAESFDAVLAGAALVLVDDELAIAIGVVDGVHVLTGRARGLSALGLAEAARRRGIRIRAGSNEAWSERPLGTPLAADEVARLGLPEVGPS